jgi:hypothetical protein
MKLLEALGFKCFAATASSYCYDADNLVICIGKREDSYRVSCYSIDKYTSVEFNDIKTEGDVMDTIFDYVYIKNKALIDTNIKRLPLYYQEVLLREWCEANGKDIRDDKSLKEFVELFQ